MKNHKKKSEKQKGITKDDFLRILDRAIKPIYYLLSRDTRLILLD
jgi:hypothetical protein